MPAVDQISQQVRALLKDGDFPAGSRMPTTAEMARMWESDAKTVHVAMTRMVKEGLIYRKPGSGTFVREQSGEVTQVGIYYHAKSLSGPGSRYIQALQQALGEELKAKGIKMSIWVDPRSGQDGETTWELLETAARRREIQGLIIPVSDRNHLRWLMKLPIPSAFHTGGDIPNKVDHDLNQFAERSVRALAEKGCRSIGLISAYAFNDGDTAHSNAFDRGKLFFETFVATARALGLEILSGGMPPPSCEENESYDHFQERMGYDQFQALWLLDRKPEGIVVYPDTFVRGVLLGIAEVGARVPDDLKLVIHKNAGIDFFCPFAVDFLVSDERDVAKALVSQMERQVVGQPVSPVSLSFQHIESPARKPFVRPAASIAIADDMLCATT